MKTYTAIVLAAGTGKRMKSTVHKQYLNLAGKPLIYYAVKAFEQSGVTDIVLVVGAGETEYCRRDIIERYHIRKVRAVVEGGAERYHSVWKGLLAAKGADYVLIHDGARPFVTADLIERSMKTVADCSACVVGMPVKDTIKVVDREGFATATPDRSCLWQIQTPQVFSYLLICEAYERLMDQKEVMVTDDAMVLEQMTGYPVRVIRGSYRNIKITTPEDLITAEAYVAEGEVPHIYACGSDDDLGND